MLEVGANEDKTCQAAHDSDEPKHFIKLLFCRDFVSLEAIEDVSHHEEERWNDASVEECKHPSDPQTAHFARSCETQQLLHFYNLFGGPSSCSGGRVGNLDFTVNLADEDFVRVFRLQVWLRVTLV